MNKTFDWKRLCSNEDSFEGLHEELTMSGGLYILDNVKMPDTCRNAKCTVEFRFYSESRIILTCVEAPIAYIGTKKQISKWLSSGCIEFCSFEHLKEFLSSFSNDICRTATQPLNDCQPEELNDEEEVAVAPPRPKIKYSKDKLVLPDTKKKYLIVNKDQLFFDVSNEIFGQDENIKKIAHLVCNHLGTKNKSRPLSIFLYGPTGIGKSAVVEEIVEAVNKQIGTKKAFAYRPVDCTQFQDRADISRLTGAAPGFVGFDEPGVFAILEDNLNTFFVFEEIEKAANNVTEVIMQAMETGKQETNGKTLKNGKNYYDLSNCVIFFTSNIEITERKNIGFANVPEIDDIPNEEAVPFEDIARVISQETRLAKNKLAQTGKFRREVIGRMNAIIKFNPINGEAVKDIAAKCIGNIAAKDHYLYITEIDTGILQEFLNVTAGEVEEFGVRALRDEAIYYFSDALRDFSHSHNDYAHIHVSGSLSNISISLAPER